MHTQQKKLEKHERVCKDHVFCEIILPDENNKTLKYNRGEYSLKVPFIIYSDLECLLQKIITRQNNPEKSYTEKKAEPIPSGYSILTCCLFDKSKNEQKCYRGKDCMIMFCKDLRKQAIKIINYEKKKIIPLTDKDKETYENKKVCYICEKEFSKYKKSKFYKNF